MIYDKYSINCPSGDASCDARSIVNYSGYVASATASRGGSAISGARVDRHSSTLGSTCAGSIGGPGGGG